MHIPRYIYSFNYHQTESELCKLESRYLFNQKEKDKLLLTDVKSDPSHSAFIKNRLDVISFSDDYDTLISNIKQKEISREGFKVEYLVFDGDRTAYADRLDKLRDIGFSIHGVPDYYHPTTIYALCCYEGTWCFGVLVKNSFDWHKHNQKPCSYSNSISLHIAKALINIAANGNTDKKLLDGCCGVGTIMLEACFAGYEIEGCEINWKLCNNARENLTHFDYPANVKACDIQDIDKKYDAAILDLPYNLLSLATEEEMIHIIQSAAKLTGRMVIVSIADISDFISDAGFNVSDSCKVKKRGKKKFARRIWVCERVVRSL